MNMYKVHEYVFYMLLRIYMYTFMYIYKYMFMHLIYI
jgi:hypothetical protein